jgi:hypothetical protein
MQFRAQFFRAGNGQGYFLAHGLSDAKNRPPDACPGHPAVKVQNGVRKRQKNNPLFFAGFCRFVLGLKPRQSLASNRIHPMQNPARAWGFVAFSTQKGLASPVLFGGLNRQKVGFILCRPLIVTCRADSGQSGSVVTVL